MTIDRNSYAKAASFGALRYFTLSAFVHPIEVVKNNMIANPNQKMRHIVQGIYQRGLKSFYQGFSPKLFKGILEHGFIAWPVMLGVPAALKSQKKVEIHPLVQQLCAGISVALINSSLTTPLDEAITRRTTGDRVDYFTRSFWRQGTKSFPSNFTKAAIGYCSFLVSYQLAIEAAREETRRFKLKPFELMQVATFVAAVSSVTTKIPDVLNVNKQLGKKYSDIFNKKQITTEGLRALLPLSRATMPHFAILWIQNLGSVFLMHYLDPTSSRDSRLYGRVDRQPRTKEQPLQESRH